MTASCTEKGSDRGGHTHADTHTAYVPALTIYTHIQYIEKCARCIQFMLTHTYAVTDKDAASCTAKDAKLTYRCRFYS